MSAEWIVSTSELARHLLIGGSTRGHEEDMEASETTDGEEHQWYDAHDDHGDDGGDISEIVLMMEDMNETEDEDTNHVESEGDEEHEEVSVVSPANAVVDPGTMMIKDLDAVVADTAVTAARWSVELAGDTPLHPHRDPADLNIPVQRSSEVIISILVRTGSRNHSRIHECRHGEVDEDEYRHDTLEDRNRVPLLHKDVPFYTPKI